jgi:hypothetical protein
VSAEFNPDWCIAPAATLREWMGEHGWDTDKLAIKMGTVVAAIPGSGQSWHWYRQPILAVLAKEPMPDWFPHMMAAVSGTSQLFWRNLEANYRDGLRRGLKDITFGGDC